VVQFNKNKQCRRAILPENTKSLWREVKIAQDVNINSFPNQMYENKVSIHTNDLSVAFASFSDIKIKDVVETTKIVENVCNGRKLVISGNQMFMDRVSFI
jgi:hypothetical protein